MYNAPMKWAGPQCCIIHKLWQDLSSLSLFDIQRVTWPWSLRSMSKPVKCTTYTSTSVQLPVSISTSYVIPTKSRHNNLSLGRPFPAFMPVACPFGMTAHGEQVIHYPQCSTVTSRSPGGHLLKLEHLICMHTSPISKQCSDKCILFLPLWGNTRSEHTRFIAICQVSNYLTCEQGYSLLSVTLPALFWSAHHRPLQLNTYCTSLH